MMVRGEIQMSQLNDLGDYHLFILNLKIIIMLLRTISSILLLILLSSTIKSQSFHLESVPDSINNTPKFSIWMTEDNIYPKVIVNR